MDLVGDQRAQSIQIGAVLLFAVLIIAFASYQAFVVPEQNREVEFNHNQQLHSQMQDLRNAVVSLRGTTSTQAVSVQLGTRYPTRAVATNPGPPSGTLRTVGTTDESVELSIANAQASSETGDFWDGTVQRYNTGGISYQPGYNVYAGAPETVYDNTVLYNGFRTGNVTLANQSFIDGNEISLVAINGSLSRSSSQSTSVDLRSVSSSTETVQLEDDGSNPITITFASTRSANYWDFLEEQSTVTAVTDSGSTGGYYDVTVELATGQAYEFQLTKVGVGTQVTEENAAYMTDIDGDGATVTQGQSTELTLEVRDRFNNPPDNASEMTVEGSVDGAGSLVSTTQTPDEDGEVSFEYQAPTGTDGEQEIQFSYVGVDGTFNAATVQNVSMSVDVQSSGGGGNSAYSVFWQSPTTDNSYVSSCSDTDCTWDVGADSDNVLTIRSGTNPALEGSNIDYSVNDTTVGTISSEEDTTDSSGEATTDLTAVNNGNIGVFAASGGSSDRITIEVTNVGVGTGFSSASVTSIVPDSNSQRQTISFTVDSALSASESVEIDLTPAQGPDRVDYSSDSASLKSGPTGSVDLSSAILTYSPDSDLAAGDTVVLRASGINVGPPSKQSNPYSIDFTRTDSGTITDTFRAAYSDGTADLSGVSATDLGEGSGQTQTISFTLDSTSLDENDQVAIDLSDAQDTVAPRVDYSNEEASVTQGTGSASLITENTENATLLYTAGPTDADTINIDLTSVSADGSGTYTVGFSREDADTTSTTFGVTPSGSSPTLNSAEAESGQTSVDLTFSEGVYTDSAATNPITASDLSYTDNSGSGASSILSVTHSAGDSTATVTLDAGVTAADLSTDEIAPVSGEIYDVDGNAASTTAVTVQDTTSPSDPVSTSGSQITSSNEGSYSVDVGLVDDHEAGDVTVLLDDGTTTVTGSTTVAAEDDGDTSTDTVTVSGIDASSLSDGSVTITARIADFASNENPSGFTASSTVVKDATAPSVTQLEATATGPGSNNDQIEFNYVFTDDNGISTVTTRASNSAIGTVTDTQNGGGSSTYANTPTLTFGSNTNNNISVTVDITDTFGNTLTCTGTITTSPDTITESGGGFTCS